MIRKKLQKGEKPLSTQVGMNNSKIRFTDTFNVLYFKRFYDTKTVIALYFRLG